MSEIVLCVSNHVVTLHDGRFLAPGEHATEIDTEHVHNAALIEDGHLVVVDKEPVHSPRTASGEPEPEISAAAPVIADEPADTGSTAVSTAKEA